MNAQKIVMAVKEHKGQHILATWQRVAKTLRDCPFIITKRTQAWVRAGIEYANLASVKSAVASGEKSAVEPLPWGEWSQYPFIVSHKGKEYVRLYPASFANLQTPKVEWSLNGQPCQYADVEQYLLASEKRKDADERPTTFTLKADDVIAVAAN